MLYVDGFGEALMAQGYTPLSARSQLELMAHVSRWLAANGLGPEDLSVSRIGEFLISRRDLGHTHLLSPRGMTPLLEHLRALGVAPEASPIEPPGAAERLLADFGEYLLRERGFAPSTALRYLGSVRPFLADQRCGADGELHLDGLSPRDITAYVLRECNWRSPGSAKCTVTRLRCLLRFLHVTGRAPELAWSVPSGPSWRLSSLPKGIEPRQVVALRASCDRRTTAGRRDFAILTALVRLGLRCGEVAALELGDLDWRAGEVIVRGKGSQEERLPLPVDVGEALAGWLRRGRPRSETTKVFTRLHAPYRGLSSSGVSTVVVSASARAGLPHLAAHRLRHTAASEMLRAGAGLGDVGQVLRHRTSLATSLYAKVDHAALLGLARAWPESAP
jgi:integrase/recombinase XerD